MPETVVLHDACKYLIKPATEARQCAYVELVSNGRQLPNWFVSHWWGEAVCQFIACLEQHRFDHRLDQNTFYWVCAYANNQWHLSEAVTSDPTETSFFKAMLIATQSGGGTVSVVDTDAVNYSRIWCDFEVATTLQKGYKYDIYTAFEHELERIMDTDFTVKRIAVGITNAPAAIDGGHAIYKVMRERVFPTHCLAGAVTVSLEKGASSVKSDRRHILNSIAGNEDLEGEPPTANPEFDRLNRLLRGKVACNTLSLATERALAEEGEVGQTVLKQWLDAISTSEAKEILLNMNHCKNGDELACQIAQSLPTSLTVLHFGSFDNLLAAPSFHHLVNLEELRMGFCVNMQKMSDLSALTHLRVLDLWCCHALTELPGLASLQKLEWLNLGKTALTSLPEGLRELPALRELSVSKAVCDPKPDWLAELEGRVQVTYH